jgi:hypothetical protein
MDVQELENIKKPAMVAWVSDDNLNEKIKANKSL